MVRVERIELSTHPWEGYILPLNYTRLYEELLYHSLPLIYHQCYAIISFDLPP